MVGSMGCLSSLAIGLAESLPDKQVIAIDGDSACLMRLGALYTLTSRKPQNLFYFVLDNEANESTGGQANCRGESRLFSVMSALHETKVVNSPSDITGVLDGFNSGNVYTQAYCKIKIGTLPDLPRPDKEIIFNMARRFARAVRK
jgi:phosphonopyruvate decarboxylase